MKSGMSVKWAISASSRGSIDFPKALSGGLNLLFKSPEETRFSSDKNETPFSLIILSSAERAWIRKR
jgi:hypothetical protein